MYYAHICVNPTINAVVIGPPRSSNWRTCKLDARLALIIIASAGDADFCFGKSNSANTHTWSATKLERKAGNFPVRMRERAIGVLLINQEYTKLIICPNLGHFLGSEFSVKWAKLYDDWDWIIVTGNYSGSFRFVNLQWSINCFNLICIFCEMLINNNNIMS